VCVGCRPPRSHNDGAGDYADPFTKQVEEGESRTSKKGTGGGKVPLGGPQGGKGRHCYGIIKMLSQSDNFASFSTSMIFRLLHQFKAVHFF
jgi:hypothetical protein